MSIEIASIVFKQSEVSDVYRINMGELLLNEAYGLWLILEGFYNGYAVTEAGVDRLHIIIHDTIHPESAVVDLHTWLHTDLPPLFN